MDVAPPPNDIMDRLEYYLVKQAPFQIPGDIRELLVKYGPWIAVFLLVITLPALLVAFGIGVALLPFGGAAYAGGFTFFTILTIINVGLLALALPGLFARKMAGWNLLFYAQVLSFAASVASGALVSGIVGLVISLYILFQVRGLYRV